MEAVNSDRYRVVVKQRFEADEYDVFVQVLDAPSNVVVFDGPDLVVRSKDEGVAWDEHEDSMLTFSGALKDSMADMFATISLALGNRDKGYEEGLIKGENRVLWEWVRSASDVRPVKPATLGAGGSPPLRTGIGGGSGGSGQLTFSTVSNTPSSPPLTTS